jgi:hypothetical protein
MTSFVRRMATASLLSLFSCGEAVLTLWNLKTNRYIVGGTAQRFGSKWREKAERVTAQRA